MAVKYAGIPFKEGDTTWIVPPLSLSMVEAMAPHLDAIAHPPEGVDMKQQMFSEFLPVIHCAMTRNYPDITVEDVKRIADMENVLDMVLAAMGRSLTAKTTGE